MTEHHPFRIELVRDESTHVTTHPGPIDATVLHAESLGAPWIVIEGNVIVAHDDGEQRFQEAAE